MWIKKNFFLNSSVGRLLRSITDSAPRANTESYAIKEALAAGEMVPEKSIHLILETNLKQFSDKTGIIIDGFPRNMQQVKYFEDKVGVRGHGLWRYLTEKLIFFWLFFFDFFFSTNNYPP